LILAAGVVGGCGSGLSGPNSNTSPGLGTLLVNVTGASDDGVVFLEKLAQPTRNGRARFYNVPPGHYRVRGSLRFKIDDTDTIDIVADKTLSITLVPTDYFPTPTPTTFPLKSRTASPQ